MASRLSDCLVGTGVASADGVRAAIARQAVYGGALDTALLELGTLDEPALWESLGQATGLPLPDPALYERPARYDPPASSPLVLDAAWSERCRAVPVRAEDGALQVLCGEPVAHHELEAAAQALGTAFVLYVVPEVRLAAVRQAVFDRTMPPRLVKLFARVAGTQPVRRWQAAQAKPRRDEPHPGIELVPPASKAVAAAGVTAAPADASPATVAPATLPDLPERAPPQKVPPPASSRADKKEFAALLARLDGRGNDAEAARAALVALTKQDLGGKPRRWEVWWEKHQDDERVEWLFEGLSHKQSEIRASAEGELRALTGEYFGYHFDLPRREREEARARWQSWWYESGRARQSRT